MLDAFPKKCLLKVMPTYAVTYLQPLVAYPKKISKMPVLNANKGVVSDKAGTKIRNAINWMLYLSEQKTIKSIREKKIFKYYLNFLTLTLPSEQMHSDEFLKTELLQPFLDWMQRTCGN